VDVRCGFRAPAHYGQVPVWEIAPPCFGGRRFSIKHRFC
jgi:hypothetical protein